jgi:hypothetical protein
MKTENLWLGTGLIGAIRWNPDTGNFTAYRHNQDNENSINSQDDVHFAFVDAQDNVWFGYHFLGISVMYSNAWNYTYSLVNSEFARNHPVNNTYEVTEDEEGNLWFPTPGGLVFHPNDASASIVYSPDDNLEDIQGLAKLFDLDDHYLILSGDGNRLFRFDLDSRVFRDVTDTDSLETAPFSHVESDTDYFISTVNNDIVKINKSTYESTRIPVPASFSASEEFGNPVLIGEDSEGNFLVVALDTSDPTFLRWESFLFDVTDESFDLVPIELPQNVQGLSLPHVSAYQPGTIWMRLHDGIFRQNLLTGETAHLFGPISE